MAFRIDGLPRCDISKSELEEAIRLEKIQGTKNLAKETGLIVKIPSESYGYCTIPSKILSDLSAETMTNAEVEQRQ